MPSTETSRTPLPASGDALLRRSQQMLGYAFVLGVASAAVYIYRQALWDYVGAQGGAWFMLLAALFGLALVAIPLAALTCLAWGVFARVESLVRARSTPAKLADRLLVGLAIALSLVPAAWPLSMAARAMMSGEITIRQPIEHLFTPHSDPLAFAENVGYWLIGAAALASLAGIYWRSRWRLRKTLGPR